MVRTGSAIVVNTFAALLQFCMWFTWAEFTFNMGAKMINKIFHRHAVHLRYVYSMWGCNATGPPTFCSKIWVCYEVTVQLAVANAALSSGEVLTQMLSSATSNTIATLYTYAVALPKTWNQACVLNRWSLPSNRSKQRQTVKSWPKPTPWFNFTGRHLL